MHIHDEYTGMHDHEHFHDHDHIHDHDHMHSHSHTHSPEHTRKVINRLSRAIGHLEKVRSMVECGEDCSQVLIQLAAVRSALTATGKVILEEHISHCIVHAVESGDMQEIDDLNEAISQFVK